MKLLIKFWLCSLAFSCCFLFGLLPFLVFTPPTISPVEPSVYVCKPLAAEDTKFAVILNGSDFALSGDGTKENPFITDRFILHKTLENLHGAKYVLTGGCRYFIFNEETVDLISNGEVTRFNFLVDKNRTESVINFNKVRNITISLNSFDYGAIDLTSQ